MRNVQKGLETRLVNSYFVISWLITVKIKMPNIYDLIHPSSEIKNIINRTLTLCTYQLIKGGGGFTV
jgi:hypothetical protein